MRKLFVILVAILIATLLVFSACSSADDFQTTIKLHEYFVDEELPEISINTKNGISISDSSLVIPDEHKGLAGEVKVYDYVKATISVTKAGDYNLDNVEGKVKVRGNYTSTYPKKPIRIKFSEKQSLVGLNNGAKLKSWVLLAEYKDTSMLRNSVAAYIGNSLLESEGYYCTDFRLVKVYMNGAYEGLYVAAEQQQVDSNRVNIPEAEKTTSVKTGYMLEYDGYYFNEAPMQQFTINYDTISHLDGTTFNATTNGRSSKGFSITNDLYTNDKEDPSVVEAVQEAQRAFAQKCVQNIWNVLYDATNVDHTSNPYHTINGDGDYVEDASIKSAQEAIEKVVDTKSLINMYILHEICQDYDISFSSFNFSLDMSEEGNKKLTYVAPWDFDYSMGYNPNDGGRVLATKGGLKDKDKLVQEGKVENNHFTVDAVISPEDFEFTNTEFLYAANTNNPWFVVYTNQAWFWQMVNDRFVEAERAGVFSGAVNMVNTLSDKYVDAFAENFEKWDAIISGRERVDINMQPIAGYFRTQKQAATYLAAWLNARCAGLGVALKEQAK